MHVGELHYLWKNGVLHDGTNSSCGCGEPVRECPLWSSVVDSLDVADGATGLDAFAKQMMAWQRQSLRTRHTRARLASTTAEVHAAVSRTVALYKALAGRGAERAIVDSSKYPAEAAALLQRSDVDLRVVHIVRDPRATAYSYLRAKRYIEPMSPAASTSHWVGFNLASELVGRAANAASNGRYLRVRHEDLTEDPRRVVAEVMRFAGLDDEPPVDE